MIFPLQLLEVRSDHPEGLALSHFIWARRKLAPPRNFECEFLGMEAKFTC